jgi:superfamily I DNA and/or RNA helicase
MKQSGSRRNEAEAEAAVDIAIAAHQAYHRQHERLVPQIISPYNAQVCEIKYGLRRRPQALGISVEESVITAYKSQGKEFPFVIVSLVRKNPERRIGFLEDEKLRAQIYVACSRAQGKLILLMSQETFGGKPLYEELVNIEGSRHALLWGWD